MLGINTPQHHNSTAMPGIASASGVLGFLADDETELNVFALQTLNDDIDTLWTEVATAIPLMCVVYVEMFKMVANQL